MRISPFWFLTLLYLAYLPIALYLVKRERPAESWNRYYDKWLKRQSLQNETDPNMIQNAINEQELKVTKQYSVFLIVLSSLEIIVVLISLQALIHFRFLFVDVFAPATVMMAAAVLVMYSIRGILPKSYAKYREIARQRAASA